jgi:hypothetical protein
LLSFRRKLESRSFDSISFDFTSHEDALMHVLQIAAHRLFRICATSTLLVLFSTIDSAAATTLSVTASNQGSLRDADVIITLAQQSCGFKIVNGKAIAPCKLTLAASPEQPLSIQAHVRLEKGAKQQIEQTLTLFDIAPQSKIIASLATSPVSLAQSDVKSEFSERLRALNTAHNKLIDARAKRYSDAPADSIEQNNKRITTQTTSPTEISRAEARLSFALPNAFKQSWLTLGAISLGSGQMNGQMSQPRTLALIGERGFKDAIGLSVSDGEKAYGKPAVQAMQASVLLYTHTSEQGQDVLLYRPNGEAACGPAGQDAAFYWIANDSNAVKPLMAGSACMNDLQAYQWLLEREYSGAMLREGDHVALNFDSTKPTRAVMIIGEMIEGKVRLRLK